MVAICGLCAAASAQQVFDPNMITLQYDAEGMGASPPGPFTLGNATSSEGRRRGSSWRDEARQEANAAGCQRRAAP